MPSEAKFSPSFHEVRPAIVPLHSFCQIFFPILSVSPCERATTARICPRVAIHARKARMQSMRDPPLCQRFCFLDESTLSISVPLPAALNLKQTRVENSILHLMKRLIFIVAAGSVALPLFGQEKSPPLKDQKD